ncbi:MAG: S-layer homology domain-containing protein [Actinobacteria bacterium]|nr:S-layer homology domain-containing protein [Actinomycetota bacterium]
MVTKAGRNRVLLMLIMSLVFSILALWAVSGAVALATPNGQQATQAQVANVTATAVVAPNIARGDVARLVGNIRIVEETAGALDSRDIWLRIQRNGTRGVIYTETMEASVARGNLQIGEIPMRAAPDLFRIRVESTSTIASTVVAHLIFYDAAADADLGDVTVEVFSSETTPTPATPLIGTVTNAIVVEQLLPRFPDVPQDHWAVEAIDFLQNARIIHGFPDGTFRPNANVTRAEFTKMAVEAEGLELIEPAVPSFPDVPRDHWAFRYIETARAAGIIEGFPDGTFRPNINVSRAEIAAIVVRAVGFPIDTTGDRFPDVPQDHWAFEEIMTARISPGPPNIIVEGYPDGTFRPDNPASRAEAATVINRRIVFPIP